MCVGVAYSCLAPEALSARVRYAHAGGGMLDELNDLRVCVSAPAHRASSWLHGFSIGLLRMVRCGSVLIGQQPNRACVLLEVVP